MERSRVLVVLDRLSLVLGCLLFVETGSGWWLLYSLVWPWLMWWRGSLLGESLD